MERPRQNLIKKRVVKKDRILVVKNMEDLGNILHQCMEKVEKVEKARSFWRMVLITTTMVSSFLLSYRTNIVIMREWLRS